MAALTSTPTLDDVLVAHALGSPSHRFLLRPKYDAADTPVEDITYGTFNMHVSRLAKAWSIEQASSGVPLIRPKDVVGVFFPSGYTLCVVLFALIRLGAVPFCLSPRNSDPALRHLVKAGKAVAIVAAIDDNLLTKIEGVLHHEEGTDLAVPILGVAKSRLVDLPEPSLSEFYPSLPAGTITSDDIAIQQHTSGSTAFPKPVPLTNKLLIRSLRGGTWWVDDLHDQSDVALGQPPIFHMFGLIGGLLNALYRGHTFALPPIPKGDNDGLFPAAQTLRQFALRIGATEFFGVSNSVVGLARSEGGIDFMKTLKRVLVAGAPMPPDNGDWIVEHGIHLVEGVGSTEGGSLFHSNRPRGDPAWQGMQVCWNVTHHFEPLGSPPHTLYELVLHSSEQSGLFPGADPVTGLLRTHDLFQEWPKPGSGRWRHCGRSDDVLLLSTGQNWNPRPMELQIEAFPVIRHAVVFGQGRPALGTLIAPRAQDDDHLRDETKYQVDSSAQFDREAIWEAIQAANAVAPQNARIDRSRVLVIVPSGVYLLDGEFPISRDGMKTIPIADKGTPLRPKSYELFKDEIHSVYNGVV